MNATHAHAHASVANRVVHDVVVAAFERFIVVINRREMSSNHPHRVVDDDALVGTRLVNAIRDVLPCSSPCAACDGVRDVKRGDEREDASSSSSDDDSHPGDTELRDPHASPRRRARERKSRKPWTHAYASFRVADDAHRREMMMDPAATQFDECAARLRGDLDALDRARERRERGEDGVEKWDPARDASAVHATPSVVTAAETARERFVGNRTNARASRGKTA